MINAKKSLGLIYFLQNGNPSVVKIGWTSTSEEKRIKKLQTGSFDKLKPCLSPIYPVAQKKEGELHHHLKKFRIDPKTEWFKYDDELQKLIELFRKNCSEESPLPLFTYLHKNNDLFEKYGLGSRWTIRRLNSPVISENPYCADFNYIVETPNGKHRWLAVSIQHAERLRLQLQYHNKYGSCCWLPKDVVEFLGI